MAHSGAGDYALGAGQGALGGAAAGASVGALFGPLAVPGAVIGGIAGAGLGLLGTALDSKAQHEKEEALRQAEAEFEEAQKAFERSQLQSGAAAREYVQQGMAAKGAADATAISGAMSEAEQQADKAGLIGAEKADYVAGVRQRIERERAASSPAVYQQVLGGARQEAQAGTQRAAIGLQTAAGKYDANVTQISGQDTSSASAAIGQSLGAVAQTAGALHGADISFAKGGAPGVDSDLTGITGDDGARGAAPDLSTGKVSVPMGDAEINGLTAQDLAFDDEHVSLMRGFQNPESKGRMSAGSKPRGLNRAEQKQAQANLLYTSDELAGAATPGDAFPQPFLGSSYATGGVAGQAGPEVVQVGEQGPELVLNAKQTQQLAQSLGGAPTQAPTQAAPAQGGPSGGGQGAFSQTPEELEAYLEELLNRAG